MSEPKFKIGDVVEFELAIHGAPRWDYHLDQGGSGKMQQATVMEVVDIYLTTQWYNQQERQYHTWCWPLGGQSKPDQWERPGYLKLVKSEEVTKVRTILVDMGGYIKTMEVKGDIPCFQPMKYEDI